MRHYSVIRMPHFLVASNHNAAFLKMLHTDWWRLLESWQTQFIWIFWLFPSDFNGQEPKRETADARTLQRRPDLTFTFTETPTLFISVYFRTLQFSRTQIDSKLVHIQIFLWRKKNFGLQFLWLKKMSFGPKGSSKSVGIKLSTWTPQSNQEASQQMFEERKELITKWWEKWNGKQRAQCLQNMLGVCTNKQIRYTGS